MGCKMVLHANLLMRSMIWAGNRALEHLKSAGTSNGTPTPFITWEERQRMVRLDDFDNLEDLLAERWKPLAAHNQAS